MDCPEIFRRKCRKSRFSKKFIPKRLKTLAFNVNCSEGNNLLHQFVLDHSRRDHSWSENYINAVLRSMSDLQVNALNDEGYSALCLAVLNNNLLMVQKLLSCLVNIDVNARCNDYELNTALHLAAELGNLSIIEELLNNEAKVNKTNLENETALCFVARYGNLDVMKLLVSKGAAVNAKGKFGGPINVAAKSGDLEAVKFLISCGAELRSRDYDDNTVLYDAAESGDLTLLEFLVSKGAEINVRNRSRITPLLHAIKCNQFEAVKFLINQGADLDVGDGYGDTILHYASRSGNLATVELLISKNVDVNIRNERKLTPLLHAVKCNQFEVVKFLINQGADLDVGDEYGDTILHYASRSGNLATVELLISKNADVNIRNKCQRTPIHHAALSGCSQVVRFLISSGADLNAEDNSNRTNRHFAVGSGYFDTAEYLKRIFPALDASNQVKSTPLHGAMEKSRGTEVSFAKGHGRTPLHMAAYSGSVETVKLLLENNADVIVDDSSMSYFHMAVFSGSLELVKFLAGRGAYMYSEDIYGDTPLHKAIRKDYLEIGSSLLDHVLNLDRDFDNGTTLLSFATINGSIRFTEMLVERGANVNYRDEQNGNTPLHDVLRCLLHYEPEFIHRAYVNEDENEMEADGFDYHAYRDKVMKMKLLLERNADVSIKNNRGESPLCIVMRSRLYPIIKLFLESARELENVHDECGITPLTYAVNLGHLDVIKLFLAKGAHVNARNKDNTTSLSHAIKSDNMDIVELLLLSGADLE